ncbi:MAG TPA: tRNA pseudouridine(38-40) synthase TruA [Steroidobacteraceae bacterium]
MPRIAVALEYDGAQFAGWQTQQPGVSSVQQTAEEAFSRIADEPVSLVCAGRTDAGVHALGQIAHFDTRALRAERSWVLGANSNLPDSISVRWARAVPGHFHARYSAEARTYRYFVLNRLGRSALAAHRATLIYRPLEVERMRAAAALLVGEHDFSAFRAAECQARSPIRRLYALNVERCDDRVIIEATANAFLHHMVRNLVGLLLDVGVGKAPPAWAAAVLASRDRTRSSPTAPAEGLYFWQVCYPKAFGLPEAAAGPVSAIIPDPP